MLEKEDPRIGSAIDTVFSLMCDDKVRMQMEAREDFYRIMDSYKEEMEEQKAEIEKQREELAAANDQIKEKDRLIAELQAALSKMK